MTPRLGRLFDALPMGQIAAGSVAVVVFALLLACERARPLRAPTQAKGRRFAITAGFALSTALVMALAYAPIVFSAVELARAQKLGVLRWAALPDAVRPLVAFVLLDYSLWLWHRLNHRVPLLWRFHAAHHADLDLDVLTAFRFHAGEMLASVPFRALQAIAIGVELPTLLAWEATILVCAELHHANVRLPLALEQIARLFVITPRLHGIHHGVAPRDVSSNFGTIFSVWDRLHGTHRFRVEQPAAIGLPEVRDPRALTLLRALALPFVGAPASPERP